MADDTERLKDSLRQAIDLLKESEDYAWNELFVREVNELEKEFKSVTNG